MIRSSHARVSGRLLEIDYKGHTAKVWDTEGNVTALRFTPAQLAGVDAARRCQVIVEGTFASTIDEDEAPLDIESIEVVGCDNGFWSSPTIEELARDQKVSPIGNPERLEAGFWGDDDADTFVESVQRWRRE